MIIATVLSMFFGKLDKVAESILIKTQKTYQFAITKSNILLRKYTSSLFDINNINVAEANINIKLNDTPK